MAKQSVIEIRTGVKMRRSGRRRWLEIECDGKWKPLKEWAEENKIDSAILYRRIVKEGRPIKESLFAPPVMVDRHGMSDSPERNVWNGMIQRCVNRNLETYKNYGGRGIKVCERWMESFSDFFADMGSRPTPKHTLERIDNDGDYEPSNCRWATRAEQSRNTRRNVVLEFRGRKKTLADWATELGLNFFVLWGRLFKLHWSVERAFTTRPKPQRR